MCHTQLDYSHVGRPSANAVSRKVEARPRSVGQMFGFSRLIGYREFPLFSLLRSSPCPGGLENLVVSPNIEIGRSYGSEGFICGGLVFRDVGQECESVGV